MPQLTVTQASKQWNISRGKLYSYIKKGSISVSKNAEGKTVIDVSELLRIFSNPHPKTEKQTHQDSPNLLVNSLQKQVDLLERELDDAKVRERLANERNKEMSDQVTSLLNRIEHFKQDDAQDKKLKKRGFLTRVMDAVFEV